jgi:hypothetical protein
VFRQNNPLPEPVMRDVQDAAHAKGVQLDILKAATQAEIGAAFATLAQLRVGGLLLGPDPFLNRQRDQLVALAARHAVPVIYDFDLPPKKWTGLGRHTLSESWADVAQGRMQATGIVKALDILEEVSAGLGAGAINPMVNPLGLEAVKEALHWRIVQTIAFAAHRGCNA